METIEWILFIGFLLILRSLKKNRKVLEEINERLWMTEREFSSFSKEVDTERLVGDTISRINKARAKRDIVSKGRRIDKLKLDKRE